MSQQPSVPLLPLPRYRLLVSSLLSACTRDVTNCTPQVLRQILVSSSGCTYSMLSESWIRQGPFLCSSLSRYAGSTVCHCCQLIASSNTLDPDRCRKYRRAHRTESCCLTFCSYSRISHQRGFGRLNMMANNNGHTLITTTDTIYKRGDQGYVLFRLWTESEAAWRTRFGRRMGFMATRCVHSFLP